MKRLVLLSVVVACGTAFMQGQPGPTGALPSGSAESPSEQLAAGPSGGYVVGNFGISAQIGTTKNPHTWIRVNPPKLGVWLQNFAQGDLWIREKGQPAHELHLTAIKESRLYPEYDAIFDAEGRVQVEVNVFAPLGLDSKVGFLPVLIIGVKLRSERAWSGEVGYTLTQAEAAPNSDDDATPWPAATRTQHAKHLAAVIRGPVFLALTGAGILASAARPDSNADTLSISAPVEIGGGSAAVVSFIAGSFDANGAYTLDTPRSEEMIASIAEHVETLHEHLRAFEAALPRTGDDKLDEYLRWYITAGILLTKGNRQGDILTMGYRELNQRDSFWTTGIHLVFWRDLECRMIEESIKGQTPSGRIPVTLLPTIDRGDEIDSSEYFVLRVARYYRWYRDDKVLAQAWPAIEKAIDYLVARDSEQAGVPMQLSYWADWKDVKGVEGRKYAPYFALLWLAALESASELAVIVHSPADAAKYRALAQRASDFINRPFHQGGMWNGTNYVDRWADGHLRDYMLEDQVVGAYFHVIPQERLESIYNRLKDSETAWGVRETYPYNANWTEEDGGVRGHYHNGGIWPYLNFVDAAGRYDNGHAAEAETLLHKVGGQDIDSDKLPNEFLDGNSGANMGFNVQGWDGDYFTALYFGAFGLERTSRSEIAIHVHIPVGRDFSTNLVLAPCSGTLSRSAGKLSWVEENNGCRAQHVKVVLYDGH